MVDIQSSSLVGDDEWLAAHAHEKNIRISGVTWFIGLRQIKA